MDWFSYRVNNISRKLNLGTMTRLLFSVCLLLLLLFFFVCLFVFVVVIVLSVVVETTGRPHNLFV